MDPYQYAYPSEYDATNAVYAQMDMHNLNVNTADNRTGGSAVIVSASPTARMKVYGMPNDPQQTRHARRIYVGGIPPNYIDEDGLRAFFNGAIAQGMAEENDHSYVVSVYIDMKKCFAFVELKSIELATACLDFDGVIFRQIVLRILRANEYKPELVPVNLIGKSIRFDLSNFRFSKAQTVEIDDPAAKRTLDSIIQYARLQEIDCGSIVIVGYPFEEDRHKRTATSPTAHRAASLASCTQTPKMFRNFIRRYRFGSLVNMEYLQDLTRLKIVDVGEVVADAPGGENARNNLTTTVAQLVARGAIPFVLGGSNDLVLYSSIGVSEILGRGSIVNVVVGSHIDIRLVHEFSYSSPHHTVGSGGVAAGGGVRRTGGNYFLFGAQVRKFSLSIIECFC